MIKKRLGKKTAIVLTCIILVMAILATFSFADEEKGYIKGYPYTFWYLRETTSQGFPCISTKFSFQLDHYSSAATYVGSSRKHYSGRNWRYDGTTSSAYSTWNSWYAYTSPYYGTEN